MNTKIDHLQENVDRPTLHEMDKLSRFIRDLSLSSVSELEPILDMNFSHKLSLEHPSAKEDSSHENEARFNENKHDNKVSDNESNSRANNIYSEDKRTIFDRVNNLCDSLSRNLISHEEFTRLMEQVRKDKEEFEEAYRKDTIKHRVEDYQGMLSVFMEGSQSFLATKAAISQLSSML